MNSHIADLIVAFLDHVPSMVDEIAKGVSDVKQAPDVARKAIAALGDLAKLLDTLAQSL